MVEQQICLEKADSGILPGRNVTEQELVSLSRVKLEQYIVFEIISM
jgi:hypothetical protein